MKKFKYVENIILRKLICPKRKIHKKFKIVNSFVLSCKYLDRNYKLTAFIKNKEEKFSFLVLEIEENVNKLYFYERLDFLELENNNEKINFYIRYTNSISFFMKIYEKFLNQSFLMYDFDMGILPYIKAVRLIKNKINKSKKINEKQNQKK
ncbi:hypothetical protein GVAV_002710 [Gurleya vavrai]